MLLFGYGVYKKTNISSLHLKFTRLPRPNNTKWPWTWQWLLLEKTPPPWPYFLPKRPSPHPAPSGWSIMELRSMNTLLLMSRTFTASTSRRSQGRALSWRCRAQVRHWGHHVRLWVTVHTFMLLQFRIDYKRLILTSKHWSAFFLQIFFKSAIIIIRFPAPWNNSSNILKKRRKWSNRNKIGTLYRVLWLETQ